MRQLRLSIYLRIRYNIAYAVVGADSRTSQNLGSKNKKGRPMTESNKPNRVIAYNAAQTAAAAGRNANSCMQGAQGAASRGDTARAHQCVGLADGAVGTARQAAKAATDALENEKSQGGLNVEAMRPDVDAAQARVKEAEGCAAKAAAARDNA